jgi:nicotinate-nucleotide pyrophosphorylase (carboxylating)
MNTAQDSIFCKLVEIALLEDLAPNGDLTTAYTIQPDNAFNIAELQVRARSQGGIFSGSEYAAYIYQKLDPKVKVQYFISNGQQFQPQAHLATISGNLSSLLEGERLFLNLLQRAISVASYTNQFVQALAGSQTKILDTRKTTPGLRSLERAAVKDGGGFNHRFNLATGILIKDNHIALAGGLKVALQSAKNKASHLHKIEVEVDSLEQIDEALKYGADVILLDNFSLEGLKEALKLIDGRALTEASGGMNLNTVAQIGQIGLDFISIGSLTQSPPQIDIGLDYIIN